MQQTTEYEVVFCKKQNGSLPVREYLDELSLKERVKVMAYVELLRRNQGYLDEPYSKHVKGKIRELRINKHRVFYFIGTGRKVCLLHAFRKQTEKLPQAELARAMSNYYHWLIQSEAAKKRNNG